MQLTTLYPLLALATGTWLLTGCASSAKIAPQYISPSHYASYNCQGLAQEYKRIIRYTEQEQKQQSTLSATGVGIGVSAGRWGISPNITFGVTQSSQTKKRNSKLAQLYGEQDAVIQAARLNHCSFATHLKLYNE